MTEVVLAPYTEDQFIVEPPHIGWSTTGTGNTLATPRKQASQLIRDTIKNKIESGIEDAFFVADLGALIRQHSKWTKHLPRVVSQKLSLVLYVSMNHLLGKREAMVGYADI